MDFHKLPDIDLRLLVIFDEIRKHRSLTLAAETLGVTQSAISKSLQRLRHQLGDTLFVRTQKGMESTPRAKVLEGPISDMLRTYYDRIATAPLFDPAVSDRVFTLHASDLGMSAFLPILVPVIKRKAPHVNITAASGSQREVLEALETGEIDLSIGAFSSLTENGIFQQRLYVERYICLVRAGHPLCQSVAFDHESFLQQTHIIITSGKSGHIQGRAESMLLDEIPPLKVAIKVPSFLLAAMLLRNTDHVLTIPAVAATALAQEFGLQCLPCPLALPEFTVLQYWHERFSHDPAGQWLRTLIYKVFGQQSFPPLSSVPELCKETSI